MGGPPKVKICGLTRKEDAGVASEAGADYLGAILSRGFTRSVDVDLAAGFAQGSTVLVAVFVDETVEEVARLATLAGAGVIQLHGVESPAFVRDLHDAGSWDVWKALKVRGVSDIEAALEEFAGTVDGLLLDGWHQERGGGAGVRFPWDALAEVRRDFPADLTLVVAGGLGPRSVVGLVEQLAPDVVDVSTGVELRPGVKDHAAVSSFIRNAKASVVS